MFGIRKKPRGMFGASYGNRSPYETPPFNPEAQQQRFGLPGQGMAQQPEQQKQPRGMDEKLYALGGLIANLGGVQNNAAGEYMAGQRQERAMAAQAAAAHAAEMRERTMDWADWRRKEDYKRENPAPQGPTAMQQNYEYLQGIDPKVAEAFLKRQTDPIQWMTGPDGIPRPYGVGGAQPPAAPVGKLTPITGGSGGNAGGGF